MMHVWFILQLVLTKLVGNLRFNTNLITRSDWLLPRFRMHSLYVFGLLVKIRNLNCVYSRENQWQHECVDDKLWERGVRGFVAEGCGVTATLATTFISTQQLKFMIKAWGVFFCVCVMFILLFCTLVFSTHIYFRHANWRKNETGFQPQTD